METEFNELLGITNTIQKCNRKMYLDIMNECQHVIKDESNLSTVVLGSFVCLFLRF